MHMALPEPKPGARSLLRQGPGTASRQPAAAAAGHVGARGAGRQHR